MSGLTSAINRFLREQTAATMVEYSIMVVFIAAVAILVIKTVGSKTNDALNTVSNTAGF